MNEILGITVPDSFADLSDDELGALSDQLRAAALAAADGDVTPDVLNEMKAAKAQIDGIGTELAARTDATAALAADLAAVKAELADGEETPEPEAEAVEPEAEPEAEVEPEAAAADDSDPEAEAEPVVASYTPVVRAGALAAAAPPAPKTPAPKRVEDLLPLGHMKAVSGVAGKSAGDVFESVTDLADALVHRFEDIRGGGNEKMTVARVNASFSDDQQLTENVEDNLRKFGGRDPLAPSAIEAVTAAMCAPAEPYYGLGAMSDTSRPVRGSMAAYGAPRGGVTIYPTPRLSDVTDGNGGNGTGIWTRTNDENDSTKNDCAVIPCASPVQYDVYGVYRCMTIQNLLQMTYPELVEAFLNRLAALQVRLAESTLLDAMVGSVNTKAVTVAGSGLDGSIDLYTTIVNAVTVYREEERYGSQELEFRAHRWIRDAVKVGLIRMRRTSGAFNDRIPTDADVDSALRSLGLRPTWTLDYAASWPSVQGQVDGQPLEAYPSQVDFLLSPVGNWRVLDRGDLNIGVTNNNIYRDNTSNSKNQFTMFFENFEGLIDFGAYNYAVSITDWCPNGSQVEDTTAPTCPATSI